MIRVIKIEMEIETTLTLAQQMAKLNDKLEHLFFQVKIINILNEPKV